MKITIIGAGNIGGAIARGLAKGHMFKASDITCTAQSDTTLEKMRNTNPDFVLSLDNVEAVKGADIIVIAVKPWRVEEIIDQIKGILDYDKQIIVSVAAGITFDLLNTYLTSGIAFALRYIRAAIEGGVELGFYPKQAQEIVVHTVKGAVDLLLENKSNPETEIDKVTTPGGITIKGLNEMELSGFTSSVIRGLKASK